MSDPKWLSIARSKIGVREIPGKDSNPEILSWIRDDLGVDWYVNDDIAWCAGFANWCLKQAGEATTNSLMARSFIDYGNTVKPQPGAILVFKRGAAPQGHVGFYDGEDTTHFWVIGGNQGNMVKRARYPKSDLLSVRWPSRAAKSRIVKANLLAGTSAAVGGGTSAFAEIAQSLQDGAGMLQPLVEYSPYIAAGCAVLTVASVAFSVWTRVKMMKAEKIASDPEAL